MIMWKTFTLGMCGKPNRKIWLETVLVAKRKMLGIGVREVVIKM